MQPNDEDEIDELFADVAVVPAKKRKAAGQKEAEPVSALTTTVHDHDGGGGGDIPKPVKKWKLF